MLRLAICFFRNDVNAISLASDFRVNVGRAHDSSRTLRQTLPVTFCILLVGSLLPDVTFATIFHDVTMKPWRFVHG